MRNFFKKPIFLSQALGIFVLATSLEASTTIYVNSTAGGYTDPDNSSAVTLVNALWNATSSNTTIDCSAITGQTITLTQPLPAIMQSGLILLGDGITIDGASTYPAFSIVNTNASIYDVTIQNAVSKGGDGAGGVAGGGGGGTGGGGAFYVENGASVTLQVVNMNSCEAIGGSSLATNGGGGGGGGGFGGGNGFCGGGSTPTSSITGGGGGGGHAGGGNSGFSNTNSLPYTYGGGAGGNLAQSAGASGSSGGTAIDYKNNTEYYSGGAGAVGSTSCPSAGSGGGGAGIGGSGGNASSEQGGNGGNGALNNYGGGGGGVASSCAEGYHAGNGTGAGGGGGNGWGYANAGNGGPSGGGGGGIDSNGRDGVSGTGGFGAGGGGGNGAIGGGTYPNNYYTYGTTYPQPNLGGSGGGVGSYGGGGSALGGAIFIQNGGSLTITDASGQAGVSFSNNSVEAGTGTQPGTAMGPDIFIRSGGTLIVDNNYEDLTFYSIGGDGAVFTGTTLEKTGSHGLYLSLKNDDDGNPIYTNYTGATKFINGTIEPTQVNALSPNSYILFSTDSNGDLYAPYFSVQYDNTIGGLSGGDVGAFSLYAPTTTTTVTINLANNASYTFGGILEANGANNYLIVTGDGTQIINGTVDGTFEKITVTGSATLEINTTFYTSQDPIVESGATLSGNGHISDTTVQGGGTILGGNYQVPNTLSIDGYLIMESNSTMDVVGTSAGFSSMAVSEDATIEDAILNLKLTSASSLIGNVPIAFLDVEGEISGSGFTTVESNLFYITGTVTEVDGSFFVIPAFRPFSSFVSNNENAKAVGIALNQVLASGNTLFAPVVESFTALIQPSELQTALNEMQPALFKGVTISQENNAVKVRDTLSYRWQSKLDKMHCNLTPKTHLKESEQKVICISDEKCIHVWTDGFGDILRQKSTQYAGSPQLEYQTKTGGAVLGLDYSFAKYFEVGAFGAYTGSTTKWENRQGKEDIETGYGGLYFSAMGDLFYANLAVLGGWSHFDGHRQIIYSGTDIAANNSHGGSQLLSHLDTGLNFGWKNYSFRPFDSFDYITQTENSYTETGAGAFNLHVKKSNAILIRNELGAQFAGCFCFRGASFTVSPKISWVREVRVKGSTYTASFENTPYYFEVTGNFPDRSLISPGVMLASSLFQDLLSLNLYYNGEFGSQYSDHNYGGQIRFGF